MRKEGGASWEDPWWGQSDPWTPQDEEREEWGIDQIRKGKSKGKITFSWEWFNCL